MKKTMILILALLPIVLLAIIAAAQAAVDLVEYKPVKGVEFVDRNGNTYTDDLTFVVPWDGEKATMLKFDPEDATNKKVTYLSANEDICTIDENGVIHGVYPGITTVTVKTRDGKKTHTMNVEVKAYAPKSVSLSETERTLYVGGEFVLDEYVAVPELHEYLKAVTWSSSDESVVSVDATGKVVALAPGTATVTVTTNSGGKTASCLVTVTDEKPPVSFNFGGNDDIEVVSERQIKVHASTLDLSEYVIFADGVSADDVTLSINSGAVTLEDWVLSIAPGQVIMFNLTATVDSPYGAYTVRIDILFQ